MNPLVLGDSLEALIDYRGKTPKKLGADFTVSGVPVASAIMVSGGRLNLDEARFVSTETWRTWMSTPTRRGDVLLTSEAPLGRVARVPSNDPLVLGQRLFGLRGRPGVLDNGFLFYALQTERVRADLIGRSTGTTVFGIRQSALRHVTIPAPSYPEQQAIAGVLGALDDKIAANAASSMTARRLAEAEFQSVSATASTEASVGSVMTLEYGKALPASARRSGPVPVYGSGGIVGWHDSSLVRGPGVVIGRKGTAGAVHWSNGDFYPIDTTFYVRPEPGVPVSFCFFALQGLGLDEMNSDSAVPGLNRNEAHAARLRVPETDALVDFDRVATALLDLSAGLSRESDRLAKTRDALLPGLMAGKIRVKDVERFVEGVV
jgi:type I restriction enzyme S subunit